MLSYGSRMWNFTTLKMREMDIWLTIRLFLLYTVLSKLCRWKLLVEVMKGWKLAKEFMLVSSARMSPAPWFLPSDYLAGKQSEETRVKIPSKLACSVYKCWSQYLDAFKTQNLSPGGRKVGEIWEHPGPASPVTWQWSKLVRFGWGMDSPGWPAPSRWWKLWLAPGS